MNNQRRKELAAINETIADLRSKLQEILDAEQEAFENMPESLQDSERGEKSQNAISEMENAIGNLDDTESAIEEAIS